MAQYFFKMTNEERTNILDQHKTIYDGYVTEYAQGENKQPLYVQDFANDKGGITVNNKGEVKPYTNMGINESIDGRLDMIGDGPEDLENGTVDMEKRYLDSDGSDHDRYSSPEEDMDVYISLGMTDDEDEDDHRDLSMDNPYYGDKNFDFDIELDEVDDTILDLKPEWSDEEEIVNDIYDDGFDEVDEEEKDEFLNKLNESLDMFRRFKKYN